MEVNYFLILAVWYHVLSSTCLKADMQYLNKNVKTNIIGTGGLGLSLIAQVLMKAQTENVNQNYCQLW